MDGYTQLNNNEGVCTNYQKNGKTGDAIFLPLSFIGETGKQIT